MIGGTLLPVSRGTNVVPLTPYPSTHPALYYIPILFFKTTAAKGRLRLLYPNLCIPALGMHNLSTLLFVAQTNYLGSKILGKRADARTIVIVRYI